MAMSKKTLRINKYDLLFVLCALVFFFCENSTGISGLDSIFEILEKFKVKYILALITCVIFILKHWGNNKYFREDLIAYLRNLGILVGLSILCGLSRGISSDIINEALYLGVPIIFAFALINAKQGDTESCLDQFFWIILLGFLLTNIGNFNIDAIKSINFMSSYSPFESNIAYVALPMAIYYKWENKKGKMIVSSAMCFLSFKRLAVLWLIAILVLPIKKIAGKKLLNIAQRIVIVVFCLIPIILQVLYSSQFESFISGLIGMDFNAFMKGRYSVMQVLYDTCPFAGGLGSVRTYLTRYYSWYTYTSRYRSMDLHCDIVRFYWECTIIGLFSVIFTYVKRALTWKTFIIVVLILTLGLTTHIFGYGVVIYWIYYYILFYHLNNSENNGNKNNTQYNG